MARDLSFLDEGIAGGSRLTGLKDIPNVSEEDINAAVRQAGEDLGVDKSTLAYEAGLTGASIKLNTLSPEELAAYQRGRADKQTEFRETGGGTQPPYAAPQGTHWSFIGGKWNLYKDFSNAAVDSSGAGASGGNGGGVGGSNTSGSNVTLKTAEQIAKEASDATNKAARQSAYDLLYSQFKQYGLESLVEPLKGLIQKDISPSQFTIELRNTPQYQTRFAANAQRVKNGFKALDEATYLGLEDSYQKLMMNYGLPNLYWEKSDVMGAQPGFEKLIAGNVDPIELEQRLQLGIDQLEKGPKQYMDAMKEFFPEISRGDILAYVLDPANALKAIQSKVKTAQIGGEYLRAGLGTSEARASELARQGVTADIARANIPTIIEAATRGGQLSDIYARHGLGEYNQATAEEELYNLGKAAEAKKKREQYGALEQSSFSGKTGVGALESGRAGLF